MGARIRRESGVVEDSARERKPEAWCVHNLHGLPWIEDTTGHHR